MKKLLFIFIFCICQFSRAQTCKERFIQQQDIRAFDILKEQVVANYQKNPKEYCLRNQLIRFIKYNKKDISSCELMDLATLEKLADEVAVEVGANNKIKDSALVPTQKSMQEMLGRTLTVWGGDKTQDFNRLIESKSRDIPNLDMLNKKGVDGPGFFERQFACSKASVGSQASCYSSLTKTVELLNRIPTEKGSVLFPSMLAKVFTDRRLHAGLIVAAKKIAERIAQEKIDGDVFHDIKSSFVKTGLNEYESEEATFLTLGAISGAGGAGVTEILKMISPSGDKVSVAISMIASGMPYLDFQKISKGLPMYSIPTEVQSKCANFRSASFWLAASQAKLSTTEFGQAPAVASSYIVIKGLAMQGKFESTFSSSNFDAINEVTRMDLATGAAGSKFGSGYSQGAPIDVDQHYVALLKNSGDRILMSPAETRATSTLTKFNKWQEMFNPEVVFNR